ncbi:MAG: serine/threonine-protein kinase [Gemmatimonadota bacterium]
MSSGRDTPAQDPALTPTRLARIRDLFDAALELTASDRAEYLQRTCASDPTLRREVESLLSALERGSGTWDRPLGSVLADAVAAGDHAAGVGTRIGPYALTRLLGVGGMGAVYEGVRDDDQFQKRVALKFLRRGHEGDLAIRRFRYERQILANLNHRNIAALLDGGVTPEGQPYIVMEFVDGRPITAYAAAHHLGLRARLQLLRQVCAAVQHAHQHLVVHRDLKPGNILVAADGTVKLLDFGIARLLREGEGAAQLPATQGGLHAFTPDYASPEQVRGLPIATSSDLYSLGVIACELLSGHRPFAFDGQLFAEMQARIALAPPPPPSTLVTAADLPHFGEPSLPRLQRQLRGDLDAIVLQALRKEPDRRYSSAEQFAADFQRHLDGLPVTAQRDTLGYRTVKFLRRRRIEVAAGVLVAASLVGGIVATTRQARRAETERAKTAQVNTFLSTMLAAVDPGNSGRDVTVAQALSQAAQQIDSQHLAPEIEAEIRHTIGQTYYGLSLYDSAAKHIDRAYALRRNLYGELDQRSAQTYSYIVALAEARASYAEAESLARIDVDFQRRMPRSQQKATELATALDNLARMIEHQGRLDEAMKVKLESLAIRRQATDSTTLASLPYTLNNLSVSYQYQGDFARAESLAVEALQVEARVHSSHSSNYGNLLRNYASIRTDLGDPAAADSLIRESIRLLLSTAGPHHAEYLRSVSMFAQLRYEANDMPGTVVAARVVVAEIGKGLHEGEPSAASTLQALGLALDSLKQYAGADSALLRSLAIRRKYYPADHWAIASSEATYGFHLGKVGREAEGARILAASYDKLAASRGADAQVTKRVAIRLADLLARMGRKEEAGRWRTKG